MFNRQSLLTRLVPVVPADSKCPRAETRVLARTDLRTQPGELLWPDRFGAKDLETSDYVIGEISGPGGFGRSVGRPDPRPHGLPG